MRSEQAAGLAGVNILILDDDATMRTVLGDALRAAGCRNILQTGNGHTALDWAATRRVDLVLCDCRMEAMDGLTFLQKLRQFPAGAAMPVIMVTGSSDEADAYQARRLKAAAWLVKPVVPASLPRHVAAALGIAPPSPVASDSLEALAAAYEARLPGEVGLLAALAARLENGELRFDTHGHELLRRLHTLKGQAGTLGYPLVGEVAGGLHDLLRTALGELEGLGPLLKDLHRGLRIGTAAMVLIAERKLRGDGGAAGAKVRDQLGAFADDLQRRIGLAVAAVEKERRALRDHQAEQLAAVDVDRWTLHGLINRPGNPTG